MKKRTFLRMVKQLQFASPSICAFDDNKLIKKLSAALSIVFSTIFTEILSTVCN